MIESLIFIERKQKANDVGKQTKKMKIKIGFSLFFNFLDKAAIKWKNKYYPY
jgi:hypothetical protein